MKEEKCMPLKRFKSEVSPDQRPQMDKSQFKDLLSNFSSISKKLSRLLVRNDRKVNGVESKAVSNVLQRLDSLIGNVSSLSADINKLKVPNSSQVTTNQKPAAQEQKPIMTVTQPDLQKVHYIRIPDLTDKITSVTAIPKIILSQIQNPKVHEKLELSELEPPSLTHTERAHSENFSQIWTHLQANVWATQLQFNIPEQVQQIWRTHVRLFSQADTLLKQKQVLSNYTGVFYNTMAYILYKDYSSGRISFVDMKIRFCWNIINRAADLHVLLENKLKDLRPMDRMLRHHEFFKHIDNNSRDKIEFLIAKYPQSRTKIADSQLSTKIRQFSKVKEISYDMLANMDISFAAPSAKTDFFKQIKTLLNKLIIQTKSQFPQFQETIRSIFVQSDTSSDYAGDYKEVEYLIGSKISMATPTYTQQDIDLPGLQLLRPELLRIIVKWMEDLSQLLSNPTQRILENKTGFKSIQGPAINLPRKRKQKLTEVINNIKKQILQPLQERMANSTFDMVYNLLELVSTGFQNYEFLDPKQVTVAKLAEFLSQCLEVTSYQYCNSLIHSINAVRNAYRSEQLEGNLDLITFNVFDLLRCKCIGPKHEILRIYREILKRTDYFEIIRVKNKLNQNTRDILINLKLKKSFLICEVQLALGQSRQEVNDHFCHFLYELQRSKFPITFEAAYQLLSIDPRISYFRKHSIYFKSQQRFKVQTLQINHQGVLCDRCPGFVSMHFQLNDRPLCCNSCFKFVKAYSTCLQFLQCPQCFRTLCPQCLVKGLGSHDKKIYLSRYIQTDFFHRFINTDIQFTGFCDIKQLWVQTQAALSNHQYLIVCVFDKDNHKIRFLKKVDNLIVDTFYTLQELKHEYYNDSVHNWCAIYVPASFKTVPISSLLLYRKYHVRYPWCDLEMVFQKHGITQVIGVILETTRQVLIIDIPETPKAIHAAHRQRQMLRVIRLESKKEQGNLELTGAELTDLTILDNFGDNKFTLKVLNLWENSLTNIDSLAHFTGLQELYLNENRVTSIHGIARLEHLIQLSFQNNELCGDLPVFNFPHLRYLDLSFNKLTHLHSLSKSQLPSLSYLDVRANDLIQLPQLHCQKLQTYYYAYNRIKSLCNLSNSKLPNLKKAFGCHNQISGQIPSNPSFKSLKVISLNYNRIATLPYGIENFEFSDIEEIHLSGNSFAGELPVVSYLDRLAKITLEENKIVDIATMSKWSLSNIKEINLSNNRICTRLPVLDLPSLERLLLSFNKIGNINALENSRLDNLRALHLDHNQIRGVLPALRLRHLTEVRLDNNQLEDITKIKQSRLPSVKIMDFRNNQIKCIIPVISFEELRQMKLDNNEIISLECIQQLQLLPKLQTISVQNNNPPLTGYKYDESAQHVQHYQRSWSIDLSSGVCNLWRRGVLKRSAHRNSLLQSLSKP